MIRKKNYLWVSLVSTFMLTLLLTSCFGDDNPTNVDTKPIEKSPTDYGEVFQQNFGEISEIQNWNMSEETSIVVTTPSVSKVVVYGTFASVEFGSKMLAVFTNVVGKQTLTFEKPVGLNDFFVIASNELYSLGRNVSSGESVSFSAVDDFNLNECVTSETRDVEVDQFALKMLPNGRNNQGRVTQSSQFISEGQTIEVTPVYSDCSLVNTLGIYVQRAGGELQEYDLWTKTQNHTSGILSRPVFHISLPVGVIFGFYIKNNIGKYYSDAALNNSQSKAAGTFTSEGKTYLAFEDMPLSGDMDYNDMVFSVKPALNTLDNDPSQWIIAVEIDENPCDYDFNDLVFKISYTKGNNKINVIPLAVGTEHSIELYLNSSLVGEAHQLMGDNMMTYINTVGSETIYTDDIAEIEYTIDIPQSFSIARSMGGFEVKVDGKTISPVNPGFAPRILLIANSLWRWPTEGTSIGTAYGGFEKWVKNPSYITWMY